MDRFQQQTAADLAGNFARNRFAEEIFNSTYHPEGHRCENCDRVVRESLVYVDGFDYWGCDECKAEAMAAIAKEAADQAFVDEWIPVPFVEMTIPSKGMGRQLSLFSQEVA